MSYCVDLLSLVILIIYAIRGLKKGAFLSISGVLSIISSYLGAYLLSPHLGNLLQKKFDLNPLAALLISSCLIFIIILSSFRITTYFIRRKREQEEIIEIKRSTFYYLSKTIGLLLGALTAIIIISLTFWFYNVFRGGIFAGELPDINNSLTAKIAKRFIQQAAYLTIKQTTGNQEKAKNLSRLVGDPAQTSVEFSNLMQEEGIQKVIKSRSFGKSLLSGDPEKIANNPDFKQLLQDESAIKRMTNLGLLPSNWNEQINEKELVNKLSLLGKQLDKALAKEEIQNTLTELKKEGLLKKEQLPQLLMDHRFLKILGQVIKK